MSDSQIPAGWYDDPAGDAEKKRYWDGAQWTEQLKDASSFEASAPVAAAEVGAAATAAAQETTPGTSSVADVLRSAEATVSQAAQQSAPVAQPVQQGMPAQVAQPINTGAPAPMYVPVAQPADNSGQAIAALVLGIVSLFLPWLSPLLGAIAGGLAITFGTRTKKSSKKGFAMAGLIMGIIGVVFAIISWIINIILIASYY